MFLYASLRGGEAEKIIEGKKKLKFYLDDEEKEKNTNHFYDQMLGFKLVFIFKN